jgi:hypothetical protein
MPSKSNYICVKCSIEMYPEHNGVFVEEHATNPDGSPAPYKIWIADLWHCRGCGWQGIFGFNREPLVEHFNQEEYDHWLEKVTYHIYETLTV